MFATAMLLPIIISPFSGALTSGMYFYEAKSSKAVCLLNGLCISFNSKPTELTIAENGLRIGVTVDNVGDVYTLAKISKEAEFSLEDTRVPSVSIPISFKADYSHYSNTSEVNLSAYAFFEIPFDVAGEYRLFVQQGKEKLELASFSAWSGGKGRILSLLPATHRHLVKHLPLILTISAIFLLILSSIWEVRRLSNLSQDYVVKAATLRFGLLALLVIAVNAKALSGLILLVFIPLFVLPWCLSNWFILLISNAKWRWPTSRACPISHFRRIGDGAVSLIGPAGPICNGAIARYALLALIFGVFAWLLTVDQSFRWSIFEERDFLTARHLFNDDQPPLGPQLLAGGRTFGSAVYWFYKLFLAFGDTPETLGVLNRGLYFVSALFLWAILRIHVGMDGALFATFIFVSASLVIGFAYWPIHPSFSIFFAIIYFSSLLHGYARNRSLWLVGSSLTLGILVQFHFTYYILLFPHIALLILARPFVTIRIYFWCLALFFAPLVPYIWWEISNGFQNLQQVLDRPRFHASYVPFKPFLNPVFLDVLFQWLSGANNSLLSIVRNLIVGVALFLGAIVCVRSLALSGKEVEQTPRHLALCSIALMFFLPLAVLVALGGGYAPRHVLPLVLPLFLLLGVGFQSIALRAKLLSGPITILVLALLVLDLASLSASSRGTYSFTRSAGEWTVDYKNRLKVAQYLHDELGVDADRYKRSVYWWWVGWAIDPELYRDMISAGGDRSATRENGDYEFLLLVDTPALPKFLDAAFRTEPEATIGRIKIFRAWQRRPRGSVSPASNARTCTRTSKLEAILDLAEVSNGAQPVKIALAEFSDASKSHLIGLNDGSIRILLTTERFLEGAQELLNWRLESPSLCGHYQEIKTIWKPTLILQNRESERVIKTTLTNGILGSLLYKTPIQGRVALPHPSENWEISFALSGYFDQSNMQAPILDELRIPLSALSNTSADALRRLSINQ